MLIDLMNSVLKAYFNSLWSLINEQKWSMIMKVLIPNSFKTLSNFQAVSFQHSNGSSAIVSFGSLCWECQWGWSAAVWGKLEILRGWKRERSERLYFRTFCEDVHLQVRRIYSTLILILQYVVPQTVLIVTYTFIGIKMWNSRVPGGELISNKLALERQESVKKVN